MGKQSDCGKPRMPSQWWIWIAVSISALAVCTSWLRSGNVNPSGERSDDTATSEYPGKAEIEAAQERIRIEKLDLGDFMLNRFAQCSNAIHHAQASFEQEYPSVSAEAYECARMGVDFVCSGEGLCGWKTCAALAYKMAVDKVKGSDLAEQAITPILRERVYNHLGNALQRNADKLDEFKRLVGAEVESFSADCCLRMKQYAASVESLAAILDEDTIDKEEDNIKEIERQVKEIAAKSAEFVGGAAISAVFIRSSCAAIKKCVMGIATRLLAKIVAKNVASATFAGGAAVADGPLPIGDVVGGAVELGCLAWTAYDLYKVTSVMPSELKSQLTKVIDEFKANARKNMLEQARQSATAALDACLESMAGFSMEDRK